MLFYFTLGVLPPPRGRVKQSRFVFTGYYMFVDPSTGDFLNYAQLLSPILPHTLSSCSIDFYYYMHSVATADFDAELKLIIIEPNSTTQVCANEAINE